MFTRNSLFRKDLLKIFTFSQELNNNYKQRKKFERKLQRKLSNLRHELYRITSTESFLKDAWISKKYHRILGEIDTVFYYKRKLQHKEIFDRTDITLINNMFFVSKIFYKLSENNR